MVLSVWTPAGCHGARSARFVASRPRNAAGTVRCGPTLRCVPHPPLPSTFAAPSPPARPPARLPAFLPACLLPAYFPRAFPRRASHTLRGQACTPTRNSGPRGARSTSSAAGSSDMSRWAATPPTALPLAMIVTPAVTPRDGPAQMLLYLNDVADGGETAFPAAHWPEPPADSAGQLGAVAGLRCGPAQGGDPDWLRRPGRFATENCSGSSSGLVVGPRVGRLLVWRNYDQHGRVDKRSVHAGCDVRPGSGPLPSSPNPLCPQYSRPDGAGFVVYIFDLLCRGWPRGVQGRRARRSSSPTFG